MLLATNDDKFAKLFYKTLAGIYEIKDMGSPEYMIGIKINVTDTATELSQAQYINDLCTKHKVSATPTQLPASATDVLISTGLKGGKPSPPLSDKTAYRSLIGGLMYALVTRPDIATAVSKAARFMQNPTEAHMHAAQRILRYLRTTQDKSLKYPCAPRIDLLCCVDASWGDDPETRKSRFGFAIYMGRSLVSWRSKLHPCICLSTAEAEYLAATQAAKEVKWLRSLLSFAGFKQPKPTLMLEDNEACIAMVNNPVVSGRNKHVELRQHYVREQHRKGVIAMSYIRTAEQTADIFTKNLPKPTFEKHAHTLLAGLPPEGLQHGKRTAPT